MSGAGQFGKTKILSGQVVDSSELQKLNCFLLNSTYTSMGELSYSAGLSCVFIALVIAGNKFDKFGLCMALALVTLASKIYFALLGIVIVFNVAAFLSFRILIVESYRWSAGMGLRHYTASARISVSAKLNFVMILAMS